MLSPTGLLAGPLEIVLNRLSAPTLIAFWLSAWAYPVRADP